MFAGEEQTHILLSGRVISPPVYSHTAYGEDFSVFRMASVRRSGTADEINIVTARRLLLSGEFSTEPGSRIRVAGQVRTYNERSGQKMHLRVLVFGRRIAKAEDEVCDENDLILDGFVCRSPVGRISPLGRRICDLLLAVNRPHGKSDYIPCVVWGRNAERAASLSTGDRVRVAGRFQSRNYRKRLSPEEYEMRTAYEVSVNMLERPGNVPEQPGNILEQRGNMLEQPGKNFREISEKYPTKNIRSDASDGNRTVRRDKASADLRNDSQGAG